MTTQPRREEIQAIRKQYKWFYPLIGGLVILVIGFVFGASLFQGDDNGLGYVTNLYTEIISIGITIVILERINEWRDTQRLKRRLIREASSKANNTAISAIDWLRYEGWHEGENSLLQGVILMNANLQNAELGGANLQGANLFGANLQDVDLILTNLQGANLVSANLKGVTLYGANLQGANLFGANLQGANLFGANLQGVNLENATLPDGSIWTEIADISRFTNENEGE